MSAAVRLLAGNVPRAIRGRVARGSSAVWLPLVGIYLIWGSTYLGIRVAIDTLPPLLMSGIRFGVAGAVLYLFAIRQGDRTGDRPGWRQWLGALLIGAALLLVGNGGVVLAERTVPSGIVALLVATVPLWMAIIDRVAFGHRLSRRAILGLVLGFGGVALLIGGPGAGRFDLEGIAIGLAAPVCWAAGSVLSRRARLPVRPLLSTAMQMLAGGFLLLLAGAIAGEFGRIHLARISTASLLALLYLTVFGSLVAFSAYVWLLRSAPLSLVSTYAFVNPVVAVALGWLFLHEPIGPRTVLAGVVIVGAVALIIRSRARGLRPGPVRPAAPARW